MPLLAEHAVALVSLIVESIVAQFIISRCFLCFVTRSERFAYTTDSASMAQQHGSQMEVDALDPKTIAVARLKYPPALKLKAPVRSACILEKEKHALISTVVSRIKLSRKEILVLYILM